MASLYLDESLTADAFVVGARIAVGGDDARHALQVARVRAGERIAVGDGRGRLASGPVVEAAPGVVAIIAEEVELAEPAHPELWLAQALAKGDRDELAVQAATELGVTGVVPWSAARSVSRWDGAKADRGRARWASIVREAAKQAIRPTVPVVAPLASAAQLAASSGEHRGLLLVLDPLGDETITGVDLGDADRITLVVGPEGGIDEREFAVLVGAGARRVRLGREVLRTSTAGPAALAALSVRLGRW